MMRIASAESESDRRLLMLQVLDSAEWNVATLLGLFRCEDAAAEADAPPMASRSYPPQALPNGLASFLP
jgi:hypothetical protein